jgi:hypothetical protein
MSSNQVSGSLITRHYSNFRGVDFSNKEVNIVRSPDSLNMWKNYKNNLGKCIETRPDMELLQTFSNTVFGLFFYKVGNVEHKIVHCGTQLIDIVGETQKVIYEGMNPRKSFRFIDNNIFYIKDGINYLEYDGETCQEVVGYIPTTSISRKPEGGGVTYEDVNLLTSFRKNSFVADGKATKYYLDTKDIDNDYQPIVLVNGEQVTDFEVDFIGDTVGSFIEFKTAPSEPLTIGQDNVVVTYKKTVAGHRDRINKCTLLCVFDNRVFFSGNENYPNAIFHSSLNNPRYCSDLDFYNEGSDFAKVRSMVAGNNALWVFKEPSQADTTVFYHIPSIDSTYGKVYPSAHSSISTGCVATGINFNDDIVFFSDRGMEAINGDVTTEQVLAHRSSLVDNRLLNESNYKNMILEEWEGYLLVIIDNKVYLADSRAMFTNENHYEYEWFYWEFDKNITCTQVKDGVLFLCTEKGIYSLTKESEIESYWTTPLDEFNYPQYRKTTNKKGCVIDTTCKELSVYAKTDNNEFNLINTYKDVTEDYVVCKMKLKKWKAIQLKFTSNKPFSLYSSTLEAYVGSYLKR